MKNSNIKNTGLLIADYPAYCVWEAQTENRWNDDRQVVNVKHDDHFVIGMNSRSHGVLYNEFYFGTVVGYALENQDCPIAAIERTQRLAKSDPYAGHKTHWVSGCCVSITKHKSAKTETVALNFGDLVRLEGRVFKLVPASNNNVGLEPADLEPAE